MNTNNWRPVPGGGEPAMQDWRAHLQPDVRQIIAIKIQETLKNHLPFSGQEGLQELKKIALRFEEKIYTSATSLCDYLRKISVKMLTMETRNTVTAMDTNNWRPAPDEPAMDTGDWRAQLQPDSRQRIVNKILEFLKKHLPFSGQEGLQELKKIALRFEENIYTYATSQPDYLRRISLEMLTMEKTDTGKLVSLIYQEVFSSSAYFN